MKLQVVLITGVTGAIGNAIAQYIASLGKYEVVLGCRNEEKAEKTVAKLIQQTGYSNISYERVDLSRLSSINQFANRWDHPLDVLINNAAIAPRKRTETLDGLEMQFATNIMGYFWMIKAFTPHLSHSGSPRIVNVASYWAGGLEEDDLEFTRRPYNNDLAYRQSKQANRMLSFAFAQKLKLSNISVNACHPGDVNSTLSNDLGFGGHESPRQGAETPVWLATRSIGFKSTGKYFEHQQEIKCEFSQNLQAVEQLYQTCLKYT